MRALVTWSRAWVSESNDSERVAVHLTGRRSARASHTTVATSTREIDLLPEAAADIGRDDAELVSREC